MKYTILFLILTSILSACRGPAVAWGDAIARLVENATLYAGLARTGYAVVQQRFNLRNAVGQYWDVYRSLDQWTFSEI